MRPLSSIPRAGIPVGHIRRGSTSTPGRSSSLVAPVSVSCDTEVSAQAPAQLSQRPHGTAPSSSNCRRRNSIRHPEALT